MGSSAARKLWVSGEKKNEKERKIEKKERKREKKREKKEKTERKGREKERIVGRSVRELPAPPPWAAVQAVNCG